MAREHCGRAFAQVDRRVSPFGKLQLYHLASGYVRQPVAHALFQVAVLLDASEHWPANIAGGRLLKLNGAIAHLGNYSSTTWPVAM